jgi:hypothetical protein
MGLAFQGNIPSLLRAEVAWLRSPVSWSAIAATFSFLAFVALFIEDRKPMNIDLSQHQHVPVRDAALAITLASGRFCGADVLRRAARRIGVLHVDERGRAVISSRIVETMAANYSNVGYLIRRGQKAPDAQPLAAKPQLPQAS